jgi:hypothetical protein
MTTEIGNDTEDQNMQQANDYTAEDGVNHTHNIEQLNVAGVHGTEPVVAEGAVGAKTKRAPRTKPKTDVATDQQPSKKRRKKETEKTEPVATAPNQPTSNEPVPNEPSQTPKKKRKAQEGPKRVRSTDGQTKKPKIADADKPRRGTGKTVRSIINASQNPRTVADVKRVLGPLTTESPFYVQGVEDLTTLDAHVEDLYNRACDNEAARVVTACLLRYNDHHKFQYRTEDNVLVKEAVADASSVPLASLLRLYDYYVARTEDVQGFFAKTLVARTQKFTPYQKFVREQWGLNRDGAQPAAQPGTQSMTQQERFKHMNACFGKAWRDSTEIREYYSNPGINAQPPPNVWASLPEPAM